MADTASLGSITCDLTSDQTSPEFSTELIYDNLTGHIGGEGARRFNIIHFNDVYNIESRDCEPVGGASRFVAAIEKLTAKAPTLVLFSGDAIMPSSGKHTTKDFPDSLFAPSYNLSYGSLCSFSQYSR